MKPNVDLTNKVAFQTQMSNAVGDVNGDKKITTADWYIGCCSASKLMVTNLGYKVPNAGGRVDAVVYGLEDTLQKAKTWQDAVDLLHKNCDEGKPTVVGVNRSTKRVKNGNPATNHFVVIVGRKYNEKTGKYEYRFYDPGTSHANLGMHPNQFFTLGVTGLWEGMSAYAKLKYTITEVRPTT
jgi:hypothetical protein